MKVGILGATGAVGRQMLASIEERNIEVDEIRLFASLKSAGKKFAYKGTYIEVEEVNDHSFDGLDYVLGAVSNSLSKERYRLSRRARFWCQMLAALLLLQRSPSRRSTCSPLT